jgi:hypothetical protein
VGPIHVEALQQESITVKGHRLIAGPSQCLRERMTWIQILPRDAIFCTPELSECREFITAGRECLRRKPFSQ